MPWVLLPLPEKERKQTGSSGLSWRHYGLVMLSVTGPASSV